ncbi:MAG: hypothetical protein O8C66_04205 [Candidatus Methanoperedens sp.]|nr:hypothetical protein [Candidatus Methanoperedens sp.]MCZ7369690.1 hypothetical protein [Candidatus Methanoperedens sp.]
MINLEGGKDIDLLAKGSSKISDDDLRSKHLKNLLQKGDIILIRTEEGGEKAEEKSEVTSAKRSSYGRKGR